MQSEKAVFLEDLSKNLILQRNLCRKYACSASAYYLGTHTGSSNVFVT